jgi:RNA polymerase sigma-70 factor (ECF subfamily)
MTTYTMTSRSGALPELERMYLTAKYVLDNHVDDRLRTGQARTALAASCMKCGFRPDCRVWLFRIIANALVNRCQHLSLSAPTPDDPANCAPWSVSGLGTSRLDEDSQTIPFSALSPDELKNAIRELPAICRMMVVLSLLEGFSHGEIADITGIQLESVMSRLHQGRDMIRQNYSTLWRAKTIPAHCQSK